LSYKFFNTLDIGLTAHWGDLDLWTDNSGYAVYNGSDVVNTLYQTSLTLKVYKGFYFKAIYEYMGCSSFINSKSLMPTDAKIPEKEIESNQYNAHSIIGGIIWEF
jgi:hypothetical protein